MKAKLEAVVFDMDGVLADTEPLHHRAEMELAKRFGASAVPDADLFVGKSSQDFWKTLIAQNGLDLDPAKMEREQIQYIIDVAAKENLRPSSGLAELLDWLDERKIKKAVASSSARFYIEKMLSQLGLSGRFDAIAGGDEVPMRKPAPDVYIKAISLLGVAPEHAAAIEDSSAGVRAATGAGLTCYGYRNPTSGNQDLRESTFQIDNLSDIIGLLSCSVDG